MTEKTIKPVVALAKEAIASDAEGLKALMRAAFQEVLEAEMTEALGAGKSERTERRLGHRSGYYERDLITRIGKIELRVPQDRGGRFSTDPGLDPAAGAARRGGRRRPRGGRFKGVKQVALQALLLASDERFAFRLTGEPVGYETDGAARGAQLIGVNEVGEIAGRR